MGLPEPGVETVSPHVSHQSSLAHTVSQTDEHTNQLHFALNQKARLTCQG